MDDSSRDQVFRQEKGGRGSSRRRSGYPGAKSCACLSLCWSGECCNIQYIPTLYPPICPPAYQSPSSTHKELCYFSFLTGRYIIGSSRLEHAPTIPRRLQTISRSPPRSPSR